MRGEVVEKLHARDGAEITVKQVNATSHIADCNRCAMPGTGPSLREATADAMHHLDWHNDK